MGFNADHDHAVSDELRFVQLTPPGSACSIAIGTGITQRRAARLASRACSWSWRTSRRRAPRSRRRGIDVSPVQDFPWGRFVFFADPDGNGWAVQQIQGARTQL